MMFLSRNTHAYVFKMRSDFTPPEEEKLCLHTSAAPSHDRPQQTELFMQECRKFDDGFTKESNKMRGKDAGGSLEQLENLLIMQQKNLQKIKVKHLKSQECVCAICRF